ncbi:MAG: DUF2182 domain-containing protein [Chloroflexi bacterium]|nr:DUF2182 domain-containing protein [Chloroflexota bacterium]
MRVRTGRAYDYTIQAVLAALIGLAWLALWLWGRSPYGRFLDHESLDRLDAGHGLLIIFFVAGWTLMTLAMMLPTSFPLVALFDRLIASRPDRLLLVALVVSGYLATWTIFGMIVHLLDWGLHHLVDQSPWLTAHAWVIGAGTLAAAGLYQFTPLKYHCLDRCRSPMSFIAEHWQGRCAWLEAFRLGIRHGLFCVGCCWTLMLLMFAVGVGSIGWMLVLGALMAIEKNLPRARWISRPLGIALGAGAAAAALGAVALPVH